MRKAIQTACGALAITLGAGCAEGEPTVMTTDSGLEYQMLRAGDGASPTMNDEVVVHYRGTLTDGSQFDASYDRGQPNTFRVDGVIAGFGEALQLMSVGGHMRVTIPSELAYGEEGAGGGLIGPNETLIFEIELLEIIEGG